MWVCIKRSGLTAMVGSFWLPFKPTPKSIVTKNKTHVFLILTKRAPKSNIMQDCSGTLCSTCASCIATLHTHTHDLRSTLCDKAFFLTSGFLPASRTSSGFLSCQTLADQIASFVFLGRSLWRAGSRSCFFSGTMRACAAAAVG